MLKILVAHGIPSKIVNAIRIMYKNTSALVVTPQGNTDIFQVDTGVLQGEPTRPISFHHLHDYTLSTSIFSSDRLTLEKRGSRSPPRKTRRTCICRRYRFDGRYDQQI